MMVVLIGLGSAYGLGALAGEPFEKSVVKLEGAIKRGLTDPFVFSVGPIVITIDSLS